MNGSSDMQAGSIRELHRQMLVNVKLPALTQSFIKQYATKAPLVWYRSRKDCEMDPRRSCQTPDSVSICSESSMDSISANRKCQVNPELSTSTSGKIVTEDAKPYNQTVVIVVVTVVVGVVVIVIIVAAVYCWIRQRRRDTTKSDNASNTSDEYAQIDPIDDNDYITAIHSPEDETIQPSTNHDYEHLRRSRRNERSSYTRIQFSGDEPYSDTYVVSIPGPAEGRTLQRKPNVMGNAGHVDDYLHATLQRSSSGSKSSLRVMGSTEWDSKVMGTASGSTEREKFGHVMKASKHNKSPRTSVSARTSDRLDPDYELAVTPASKETPPPDVCTPSSVNITVM